MRKAKGYLEEEINRPAQRFDRPPGNLVTERRRVVVFRQIDRHVSFCMRTRKQDHFHTVPSSVTSLVGATPQ
uniref:Uncharacterized protein n=1 Tax=Oryza glumipatula TaxID=40148 RepID=A0A0D9YR84_9ORYZ